MVLVSIAKSILSINTEALGNKGWSMDMGLKCAQMARSTRENFSMASDRAMEN